MSKFQLEEKRKQKRAILVENLVEKIQIVILYFYQRYFKKPNFTKIQQILMNSQI